MRESDRLDHDRWHACARLKFFSRLRIPGGMCGERADEVGEVIERRYIGHNSSHNTPIATPNRRRPWVEQMSCGVMDWMLTD